MAKKIGLLLKLISTQSINLWLLRTPSGDRKHATPSPPPDRCDWLHHGRADIKPWKWWCPFAKPSNPNRIVSYAEDAPLESKFSLTQSGCIS